MTNPPDVNLLIIEVRKAEGLAAPHPNYPGKESSLHREGMLLDVIQALTRLSPKEAA